MFSGGAYSRYSALENPYIVRETTDAVPKNQNVKNVQKEAAKRVYVKRQEKKMIHAHGTMRIVDQELNNLTSHLNLETTQNQKDDHYKQNVQRKIADLSKAKAAAKNSVDHYAGKIKTAQN